MPRGVYERKPRADKAPAAKKAAPKKVVEVKTVPAKQAAKKTNASTPQTKVLEVAKPVAGAVVSEEGALGFHLLGQNITLLASILSNSGTTANAEWAVASPVYAKVAAELEAQVECLARLRRSIFGEPAEAATPIVEEVAPPETHLEKESVPSFGGTLPQGNPDFKPPAPPSLPIS